MSKWIDKPLRAFLQQKHDAGENAGLKLAFRGACFVACIGTGVYIFRTIYSKGAPPCGRSGCVEMRSVCKKLIQDNQALRANQAPGGAPVDSLVTLKEVNEKLRSELAEAMSRSASNLNALEAERSSMAEELKNTKTQLLRALAAASPASPPPGPSPSSNSHSSAPSPSSSITSPLKPTTNPPSAAPATNLKSTGNNVNDAKSDSKSSPDQRKSGAFGWLPFGKRNDKAEEANTNVEDDNDDSISEASEASNLNDVTSPRSANPKAKSNQAKFNQMKTQRNLLREQLKQANAELQILRVKFVEMKQAVEVYTAGGRKGQ